MTDRPADFDHLRLGTPESDWLAAGLLDDLAPAVLPGGAVLVVAAHPDDETLGAGGLLARVTRSGRTVTVVVGSDGEASHPRSTTTTPAQLAARRRTEVVAAVGEVAPSADVHFLGLPDGGLDGYVPELVGLLAPLAATTGLIVSPWSADRHPDHEACALAAARVAASVGAIHWQYPIWAWHWGDPAADDLPRAQLRALPLDDAEYAAKLRALGCHVSQHSPLSDRVGDEAILPPGVLSHFTRRAETFVVE